MTVESSPVTIVVLNYNYGRFLGEAIESALCQTVPAREVIVVDDGSTDDSAAVAEQFQIRIRFVRRGHAGQAATRNFAGQLVTTLYMLVLDADDRLDERYIELCLEKMRADPDIGFVYTQVEFFGAKTGVSHYPAFSRSKLLRGNYVHSSALVKTELVQRHPFAADLESGEDWDFYLRLIESHVTGALLDRPLLHYRRHAASSRNTVQESPLGQLGFRRVMMARHRHLYPWWRRIAVICHGLGSFAAVRLRSIGRRTTTG